MERDKVYICFFFRMVSIDPVTSARSF